MKKGIAALLAIIVLAVGLALVLGHKKTTDTSVPKTTTPSSNTSTTPTTTSSTVDIQDFAFSPKTISVKRGTTITWTNKDSAAHTVTFDDATLSSASSGNMAQGDTFKHKFDATGSFTYHCAYHASMTAKVVVTE